MSDIETEAVEAVLDSLGVAWKRRDDGWVIPATARTPCEVKLETRPTDIRIEAGLTSWDEIGPRERAALALLLEKAATVPGAQFDLGEGRAAVVIDVPAGESERALGGGVGRAFYLTRLLSREAAALLDADIAERYLSFFGAQDETVSLPRRI